ncbi:hypothetical protein PHLCEN_2v6039 [Hermanssonia centrifuga]|uniref:O-acyltransferase n=1 Tax=Hermanssonia centrifuga TaxID=98765 RepID=A0A2R6P0P7_9APHY|nr:hypothetical protein PHLCEN_2v6039 [Hermanssonia centrifuga]
MADMTPVSETPTGTPDSNDFGIVRTASEKQFATAIMEVVNPQNGGDRMAPQPTRTASGGIETTQGTVYVSKPFRSGSSKKLRAVVAFAPRKSHFDISNERSGTNEFRGFFTLFWLSMFLFSLRTYVRSIETNGYALNLVFASMFSEDAITLALSDAVLVSSTAICVPFARAVSEGWIKYYWAGLILQHLWQTSVLFLAVTWTFDRHWPWVQSGYLTLHTLVMIMKMHSYMSINGYLKSVDSHARAVMQQLRQATAGVGGWDEAIVTAKAHREELDGSSGRSETETTPVAPVGSSTATNGSPILHKRTNTSANTMPSSGIVTTGTRVLNSDKVMKPGPHPLVDHPDKDISSLAREYSELESELISTGPSYVKWPHNITLKNFAEYMLIPTLVYELEYPRTDRIRPLYVFEKTVATFGTFALLYTVTESFILPLTPTPDQSFFRSLLDLALPFMIAYLLLFYLIFGKSSGLRDTRSCADP